jgi:hypothetical protein
MGQARRVIINGRAVDPAADAFPTLFGDFQQLPDAVLTSSALRARKAAQPKAPKPARKPKVKGNPLLAVHGPGPEGATCAGCRFLYRKDYRAGEYFKCSLRGDTNGAGTDHRASWPACGKFEQRPMGAESPVVRRSWVRVTCHCGAPIVLRTWRPNVTSYGEHTVVVEDHDGYRLGQGKHTMSVVVNDAGDVVSCEKAW